MDRPRLGETLYTNDSSDTSIPNKTQILETRLASLIEIFRLTTSELLPSSITRAVICRRGQITVDRPATRWRPLYSLMNHSEPHATRLVTLPVFITETTTDKQFCLSSSWTTCVMFSPTAQHTWAIKCRSEREGWGWRWRWRWGVGVAWFNNRALS